MAFLLQDFAVDVYVDRTHQLAQQPAQLDETEDVSDLLAKLEASVRRRREQSGDSDGQEPATSDSAKKAAAKKAPARKAAAKK